ncbi:unnamed protein product [Pieris macdunnoughi]|uniref:Uncharacterized protein n=1 Tax=Pieris macdunnoughi TaxID=345717 RepID=A0A821MLK6_9NEOP|nr:unnamed protein product [Pieris macdunnoughi]
MTISFQQVQHGAWAEMAWSEMAWLWLAALLAALANAASRAPTQEPVLFEAAFQGSFDNNDWMSLCQAIFVYRKQSPFYFTLTMNSVDELARGGLLNASKDRLYRIGNCL